MHSLKNLNIMNFYLFSRHCFPSRIFCMKAVIVACSYAVSNSESVHSYKQREQATKTTVKQNISLKIQGNIQKSQSLSQCENTV